MVHLFISYSRTDREYALRLAAELERRGYSFWIDQENIPGGSRWWQEVAKSVRNCCAIIVVMTPEAEQSEWVEKEIMIGKEENKPIFPLLLRGKRFDLFINIQYIDISSGELPPDSFYIRLPDEARKLEESSNPKSVAQFPVQQILYPNLIQRWRVTKSLEIDARRGILLGDGGQTTTDGAWEIQTPDPLGRGVYGPYISLIPSKYQVTFRLKIADNIGDDGRLALIDATSRMANKYYAQKTLTVQDFTVGNIYQDFHLEFDLFKPDENFEFRLRTHPNFEAKKRLTLDYVELRSKETQPQDQSGFDHGSGQLLTRGEMRLNSDTYEVHIGDKVIQLTSTEHRILRHLMENFNRVLSPSHLLQAIWEYPPNTGDPDLVRAHIRNLSAKLDRGRAEKQFIRTIHGVGYMLSIPE
jgi:hypothetical protein